MPHDTPESTVADLDIAGKTLGDYRVLRRLGRGAMAEVYLAEQQSLKRNVAIKILLPSLAGDEAYVRRFHREAQAAAALTHPNIVQIYEVGQRDGLHFIAQEYVPGQNLKQLLSRRGPVDVKLTCAIIRQVASALAKAAEHDVVHRDIKPENILITATGEVKVADFGLARVMSQSGDGMNLTQIGVTMGTPLYMSPEQIEGRSLDARSDIYSLGITVYHLLAGKPPFDGDNPLTVAVKHLKTEPERLEKIRGAVPPALARVVHKMVAKSPEDRHQTAAQLLKDLRELQTSLGTEFFGSDPSDWSIAELATLSDPRQTNSSGLAAVMKASATTIYRRNSAVRWGVSGTLVLVMCLVIGGLVAWARLDKPLLFVADQEQEEVLKWASAEEQFEYAMFKNLGETKEPRYFRSVEEHFPPQDSEDNIVWVLNAKKQEAMIYLDQENYSRALQVFTELSQQADVHTDAIAFGFAGRAITLFHLNRISEAEQAAARVSNDSVLRQALERPDPGSSFLEHFERTRSQLIGSG
ncbi:MAG: serine/threonine-protein kinase [Pirellulaceae bacterium]